MSEMPLLEITGVAKRFGGVTALDGAQFSADAGSVHALLGPNGSGKSTLLKVLTGLVRPDAGTVTVGGRAVGGGPRDAIKAGVATVYQELSLVPDLSIAENIVLGAEPAKKGFLDRKDAAKRASSVLEPFAQAFGGTVPVRQPVAALEPAERQVVEIGKALARNPRVLVLDEATASLRQAQVAILLDLVRDLARDGVCVVFTSHRLLEIQEVCEQATILRGGRTVATVPLPETDEQELVRLMVGELGEQRKARSETEKKPGRLVVSDLTAEGVHGVSFTAAGGEVLGIGGLQGQGQSALLATLFGARKAMGGTVTVDGQAAMARTPAHAMARGFAYVPGNRAAEGLALSRPILENLALPSMAGRAWLRLGLSRRREVAVAREVTDRTGTTYGTLDDPAASLSGGNQQKIVFAKWLPADPVVVLMDDPLKGVDVRAKEELLGLVRGLAADGAVVILSSSDDRELLEVCDRVLVMSEGKVTDELSGTRLTDDALLASALGAGT